MVRVIATITRNSNHVDGRVRRYPCRRRTAGKGNLHPGNRRRPGRRYENLPADPDECCGITRRSRAGAIPARDLPARQGRFLRRCAGLPEAHQRTSRADGTGGCSAARQTTKNETMVCLTGHCCTASPTAGLGLSISTVETASLSGTGRTQDQAAGPRNGLNRRCALLCGLSDAARRPLRQRESISIMG